MPEPETRSLKRVAQETVLRDLAVTPEMRARLARRIGREEAAARTRPAWWAPAGATAVAAALLLVVGSSLWPPTPAPHRKRPEIPPPTTGPAAASPGRLLELEGQPAKVTISAHLVDQSSTAFSVTATDASGKAVEGSGATPPAAGIPGVEARPGQKIVLNADYTLEVKEAHAAMAALQAMTATAGGYVVEATLNQGEDGSWAGRLLLRIPAAQFSGATARMADFGQVKHQRQWAQDVTDQQIDLTSRLTVLREHEQKLQELALKAANFDDWLRLAKQLNETRIQVENLEGTLKQLNNKVEYSTLNIGLVQPAPGQESVAPSDGLGRQMSAAFGASIQRLMGLGRSLLVWLAAAAPLLVPVAALAGIFLAWLRRRRARASAQ